MTKRKKERGGEGLEEIKKKGRESCIETWAQNENFVKKAGTYNISRLQHFCLRDWQLCSMFLMINYLKLLRCSFTPAAYYYFYLSLGNSTRIFTRFMFKYTITSFTFVVFISHTLSLSCFLFPSYSVSLLICLILLSFLSLLQTTLVNKNKFLSDIFTFFRPLL